MEQTTVDYSKDYLNDMEHILSKLVSEDIYNNEIEEFSISNMMFNYSLNMDTDCKSNLRSAISDTMSSFINRDLIKDFSILKRNFQNITVNKNNFLGNSDFNSKEIYSVEEKEILEERKRLRDNLDFLFSELSYSINLAKFKYNQKQLESSNLDSVDSYEEKESIKDLNNVIKSNKFNKKSILSKFSNLIVSIF